MAGGPSPVRPVTVTIGGVEYHGTYYVQYALLYVKSPYGTKVTQVAGTPPEMQARILLSEMVRSSEA